MATQTAVKRGRPRKNQVTDSLAVAQETNIVTIIPPTSFEKLKGWAKLNQDEQKTVLAEGQGLAAAMLNHGFSKVAIGEHLSKLRDVLEPHNLFGKFLSGFHFSKRTAYRYINGYKNAKAILPESVLKVAMARGFNIIGESEQKPLGIYTEAVKQLPPPQNATEEQANVWLEQVDNVRKQNRTAAIEGEEAGTIDIVPSDPQTLLKECYRFVASRYKKLPSNGRTRQAFIRGLMGMLMTEFGLGNAQTYAPVAIPEDYRAQRGRPRQLTAASAA